MQTRIRFVIAALLLSAFAKNTPAQQAIINELYRSGNMGTGDEWIEIVLPANLTAAELNGLFVGDSTNTTTAKFSGYGFENMETISATFLAGTIIVVSGQAGPAEDLTYDPFSDDWNLVLHTNNATHILGNGSTGDLAAADTLYVDTDGTNGNATLAANGFGVNWSPSPGAFGLLANVTITGPGNVTASALTSALAGATTPGNWSGGIDILLATPGQPNGGANTTDIAAIRASAVPVELSGFELE